MATATETHPKSRILPEEFERIFREHYGFVHRTAHRVTANIQDAEDVLQTLFLRLLRFELPLGVVDNPRKYLYRATVNIALDLIRARRRRALVDEPSELLDKPATSLPSRGEEEILDHLRSALAELNPRAAEILILRHVHGYSDAEIARFLGTSRGTIAVSLFRSKARLRKRIRGYLEKPS